MFENEYPPFSSVTVLFPVSLSVTFAPGTVTPLSSSTFPQTLAVFWANRLFGKKNRQNIKNNVPK